MKWIKNFFDWLKSLIGKIMKLGTGGNAAGKFTATQIVKILKQVDLDSDGNEIPNTVIYRVVNSCGATLKESPSLKEIFYWLDDFALEYSLG